MAAPGTPLQALIAVLVMLFHLLVVLKLAPYESEGEDLSSFLSSLTLLLTTIGGLVLMNDTVNTSLQAKLIGFILVGISGLCILSEIGIAVFVDCGLWDKIQRKKGATQVTPVLKKVGGGGGGTRKGTSRSTARGAKCRTGTQSQTGGTTREEAAKQAWGQ